MYSSAQSWDTTPTGFTGTPLGIPRLCLEQHHLSRFGQHDFLDDDRREELQQLGQRQRRRRRLAAFAEMASTSCGMRTGHRHDRAVGRRDAVGACRASQHHPRQSHGRSPTRCSTRPYIDVIMGAGNPDYDNDGGRCNADARTTPGSATHLERPEGRRRDRPQRRLGTASGQGRLRRAGRRRTLDADQEVSRHGEKLRRQAAVSLRRRRPEPITRRSQSQQAHRRPRAFHDGARRLQPARESGDRLLPRHRAGRSRSSDALEPPRSHDRGPARVRRHGRVRRRVSSPPTPAIRRRRTTPTRSSS